VARTPGSAAPGPFRNWRPAAPQRRRTWVGIGGVSSRDLIQAGTQDVASGTGQSQFQAWIEMLPAASQQVPLAVAPGDSVTVSIAEQGAGTGAWQIVFKNNTSGQTYQTTVQYTSFTVLGRMDRRAPAGRNGVLPLDNFGSVSFSGATAVQNSRRSTWPRRWAADHHAECDEQALAIPSTVGSDDRASTSPALRHRDDRDRGWRSWAAPRQDTARWLSS